jgi:hypothetical protein
LVASQVAKPDGLVVVDPSSEIDFLHDLPVELMWGRGARHQGSVGRIRERFRWSAIGYGSVVLGGGHAVPDEFRELAEKEL